MNDDLKAVSPRLSPDPAQRRKGCPFSIPMKQDDVLLEAMDDQFDAMRPLGSLTWTQMPYGTINDGQAWVATGFETVKTVLADNRFSVAQQARGDYPRARVFEVGPPFPPSFVIMDPPEIAGRRRTLLKHLTAKRVDALRPATARFVSDCLDRVEAAGQGADLRDELNFRVPLLLICELMGAPAEERHIYMEHAHNYVSSRFATIEEGMEALNVIKAYFVDLCQRKRANPGNDLISAMLHDVEVRGLWPTEELEAFGFVLLTAGHDSTGSVINCCVNWLIHNPDDFARLRAEPDLVPRAVDEFLRLMPVGVPATRTRVALEDVQVGDVLVRKDESVLAIPHAGNIDPAVYACPRTFDLDREETVPHIAFGHGAHFCIGAQLARMDIEMVLRGLTERFATLEPYEYDPDWRIRSLARGPRTMPVRWTK